MRQSRKLCPRPVFKGDRFILLKKAQAFALLAVEFALWLAIVRFRNKTADAAGDFPARQAAEAKSAPDWYALHSGMEHPAPRLSAKRLVRPLLLVLLSGAAGFAAIYLVFHVLPGLLFPSGGELPSFLGGLEILLYLGWLAFLRSLSMRMANQIQPPEDPAQTPDPPESDL